MNKYVKIDKKNKNLALRRPFGAIILKLIQDQLMLLWTYNSNAIEGNTLTYNETSFYLLRGLTAKGKSLEEHLEISNHRDALNFLEETLKDKKFVLSEKLIRELHQILFKGIDSIKIGVSGKEQFIPLKAGKYKEQDNHVLKADGTIHYYVPAVAVSSEMQALVKWVHEQWGKLHPIELAAHLHYRFVRIHPFLEGNGRVARLIMNLILLYHGYPPAIIKNEFKNNYYHCLEKADEGNLNEFIQLVAKEVSNTIDLIFNIVDGKSDKTIKKHPIYKYRKLKEITQKELAMLSGVEQATISKIENMNAKPQHETLKAIAKALKIDVNKIR